MTVTLDESTEKIIQTAMDRGAFDDPSQAVACAVHLLLDEREGEDWLVLNRDTVQAALAESIKAEAEGDSFSPAEVEELLRKYREERRAQAA